MIQLNDITFGYKRRGNPVFSHFSMNLEPDSIYGLLGKNGAGKSTLLYLMCGLLRPQSGEALFNGKSVVERRPEILEDIFIVPEEFELPPLKLSTYVKINAPFYPHFSEELLSQCLQDFELPEDINLGGLSMGQKKKAFIAFAIATNTRLLLMDEPTNGLDIPAKACFRRVVARQMREDRTIVISTHQVRDVDALLDHVAVVDHSKILLNASTADITSRLVFEQRTAGEDTSDALYAQPNMMGNAIIARNTDGRDSQINLEMLFNALMENNALMEGNEETSFKP